MGGKQEVHFGGATKNPQGILNVPNKGIKVGKAPEPAEKAKNGQPAYRIKDTSGVLNIQPGSFLTPGKTSGKVRKKRRVGFGFIDLIKNEK